MLSRPADRRARSVARVPRRPARCYLRSRTSRTRSRQQLPASGSHDRGYRSIVTLPTGAGKTEGRASRASGTGSTASYEPRARQRISGSDRAAGLAHTEELCEQACACFRQVLARARIPSLRFCLIALSGAATGTDKETMQRALESPSRTGRRRPQTDGQSCWSDSDAESVELVKQLRGRPGARDRATRRTVRLRGPTAQSFESAWQRRRRA